MIVLESFQEDTLITCPAVNIYWNSIYLHTFIALRGEQKRIPTWDSMDCCLVRSVDDDSELGETAASGKRYCGGTMKTNVEENKRVPRNINLRNYAKPPLIIWQNFSFMVRYFDDIINHKRSVYTSSWQSSSTTWKYRDDTMIIAQGVIEICTWFTECFCNKKMRTLPSFYEQNFRGHIFASLIKQSGQDCEAKCDANQDQWIF